MEIKKQTEETVYKATIELSEYEVEMAIKLFVKNKLDRIKGDLKGLKLHKEQLRFDVAGNKIQGALVDFEFKKIA